MLLHLCSSTATCKQVETNITCTGSGELTNSNVMAAGPYTKATYAKVGSGITIIGDSAFKGCGSLSKIDFPSSVVQFKGFAFQGCGFVTFTVPAAVKTIEPTAWNTCSKLTHIYVASTTYWKSNNGFLTDTSNNLFAAGAGRENGKTLTLPAFKKLLSHCLRWNKCAALVISGATTTIQASALYKCTQLKNITLGVNLTTWDISAMSGCSALTKIILNGNKKFYYVNGTFGKLSGSSKISIIWVAKDVTTVNIASSITTIGSCPFQDCPKLTKITVSSSNSYFGAAASGQLHLDRVSGYLRRVKNCVGGATSITIPSGITHIAGQAFLGCSLLKTVVLRDTSLRISGSAFRECKALTTFDFKGCTITDNNDDAAIPGLMLSTCTSLTTITSWPDNNFFVGSETFVSCTSLTSITLPAKCHQLKDRCFSGCTKLAKVTIPSACTFIGTLAFHNCKALTSVTFTSPSKLATLESMAFSECTALKEIKLPISIGTVIASCFSGCTKLVSITFNATGNYISDGIAVYKKNGNNNYYTFTVCPPGRSRMTLNTETRTIASNAFYACTMLIDVTIPKKMTEIAESAFYRCSSLELIRISSSVTSIGARAFEGCSKLRWVHYCSNNDAVSYVGDPFPTDPSIYIFYDFPREAHTCNFCGHMCQPILDHECNIPTETFMMFGYPNRTAVKIMITMWKLAYLISEYQ